MDERKTDEKYMRRCLQLARCGRLGAAPNPMVGAVIVHDGRIIGEGYHRRCGEGHAEVNAIASVAEKDRGLLKQSTIYVSLEPCAHYGKTPPCAQLIIDTGIPCVVVGCRDPFVRVDGRGISMLREAGILVREGVLEQECLHLNRRFITFHTLHRPFVTLKWAQSEDGFIDRDRTSCAEPSVCFSTPATRALVHQLRAEHDAILIGRRTMELDCPSLTVRYWNGKNPLPIVIGKGGFKIGDDFSAFRTVFPHSSSETSLLSTLLEELWKRGIQSLLVEGGAQTLQGFIDEGLWDEARIETAPMQLNGGVAAPHIDGTMVKKAEFDGNCIVFLQKNLKKGVFQH